VELGTKTERGRLALGQILALPLDGQLRVACDAGLLWVTGESTGDVLLHAGCATVVSGRGRVVLEALEPATYSLRTRG
jgi:hypothetical protein